MLEGKVISIWKAMGRKLKGDAAKVASEIIEATIRRRPILTRIASEEYVQVYELYKTKRGCVSERRAGYTGSDFNPLLVSQFKILAQLDPVESRNIQTGFIMWPKGKGKIRIQVIIIPTLQCEEVFLNLGQK